MANASARGLVLVPRLYWDGEWLSHKGGAPFSFAELRHYALYWDRLDFPENNFFNFDSSWPEISWLEGAGVLQRTPVVVEQYRQLGAGRSWILAQYEAFQRLSVREPGLWALGQLGADFYELPDTSLPVRAVEIELHDALPTPPDTVSLADVLEFKTRRAAELLALRGTLDELYLEIERSQDIPRAKVAAVDRLARSLSELRAAANESWSARLASSLKVELNVPEIAAKATLGVALAVGLGVPPAVGAAIGAASAASLKLNVREIFAPRVPTNLLDFAYVYHQSTELR